MAEPFVIKFERPHMTKRERAEREAELFNTYSVRMLAEFVVNREETIDKLRKENARLRAKRTA